MAIVCKPVVKRSFVVVTNSRVGSSALIQGLRDAGVVVSGELFHEDARIRRDQTYGEVDAYRDGEDGDAYLRRFLAPGGDARGCCLLYEQARHSSAVTAWDFLAEQSEIAVIHLVQRDLLASWVADEVARRGSVSATPGDGGVPPFEIDAEDLERHFDRVVAQRAWIRRALRRGAYLELRYEDELRVRFADGMTRVLGHIGAIDAKTGSPPARLPVGDAVEWHVANLAELRARFQHSPHAEYFARPYAAGGLGPHPGFCSRPFEFFGVDAAGKIRVCCEDWLPTPIGDVRSGSPAEQWNSPTAVAVRESILDGSYRYCDSERCPALVKGALPPIQQLDRERDRRWVQNGRTVLDELPETLSLGYDPTCNLKCATCRSGIIALKGAEREWAAGVHAAVVEELMPTARQAIITGNGDALASPIYRRFLRTFDRSAFRDLRLLLMTNGLLLTARMWDSLAPAHGAIAGVSISVDAATPETYALNRGGRFEKLVDNLRFLGELQRGGEIEYLEISFVVQTNNYREMPAFVALAREVGCTSVLFMKLIHWPGTYDEAEHAVRAVHARTHPLHEDFLHVLSDPSLDAPNVDLSNLSDLRPLDTSRRGE
jgi:hypothetical protein